MCDLICDVFEAEIRVKSALLLKSLENQKKRENVEIKDIFT